MKFCPTPSLIFSWKRLWRAPSTTLKHGNERWIYCARLWPTPVTIIGGNPLQEASVLDSFLESALSPQNGTTLHTAKALYQRSLHFHQGPTMVRHLKPIQHNPALPGAEDYYFYHDSRGRKTAHYKVLWWYLKEIIRQGFFKEYILTSRAASDAG